jgi:hypothetical protein
MSSIGSSTSFWQQDQAFQQQSQQQTNSSIAAAQSINSAMSAAEANLGKGLASIANATALKRVDTQLAQEIQNVLTGNTGQPLSSSTSSSAASSKVPVAATGTGTAALTTTTPLSTLGIPAGGVITVSAGQNMTTYASTGSDTVGNLMNAINSNLVGNAAVTATLNPSGRLVLTSKNTTDTITVGALYSRNVGFGASNNTFKPTTKTSTAPPASPPPAASTQSSSTTSTKKSYTTPASERASTAASLLSASGVAGSIVNMLA